MTKMTGPDCTVMCNFIYTHTRVAIATGEARVEQRAGIAAVGEGATAERNN